MDKVEMSGLLKPYKLPEEKKKALRRTIVALAGALRHETQLRWVAERERDEASATANMYAADINRLNNLLNMKTVKLDLEQQRAKESHTQAVYLEGKLVEANERLRTLGLPEVEWERPVLPVRDDDEEES